MTDAQISRALALAIGYRPEDVRIRGNSVEVRRPLRPGAWLSEGWHLFSYGWPDVAWAVAERYDCFPYFMESTQTWTCSPAQWALRKDADTAAKAVALAVIKAEGGEA